MVRITYYLMLQLITKSAFTVPTHALCGIYNRAFHLREWGVNYSTHQLTVCTTLPSFLGDKYSLKAWQPLQIGDSFAIEASNRYFSWKGSNGIQQPVSFSDMVNPNKVLAGLAGTEYIHTHPHTGERGRLYDLQDHRRQEEQVRNNENLNAWTDGGEDTRLRTQRASRSVILWKLKCHLPQCPHGTTVIHCKSYCRV